MRPVVDRLNAAIRQAMSEVLELCRSLAAQPITSSPEQHAASVEAETGCWARMVDHAGIRVEQ